MKIYVLFGDTGEYSDHSDWAVRAYFNKEDADADCAFLNAIAQEIFDRRLGYPHLDEAVRCRLTPHDPEANMDYTGTHYSVTEMDLVDARQTPENAK